MSQRQGRWLAAAILATTGVILWFWMGESAPRATTVKIVGMALFGIGMLSAAVITARRGRPGGEKP